MLVIILLFTAALRLKSSLSAASAVFDMIMYMTFIEPSGEHELLPAGAHCHKQHQLQPRRGTGRAGDGGRGGGGRGGGRRRRGRRRNIFRAGAPVSLPGPETAVFGC